MTTPAAAPRPPLVVGLGTTDRGDDGIGCVVADLVAVELAGHEAAAQVVVHDDPTALLDLMDGRRLVVVADAVCSGAPAGTVTVLEVGRGDPAPPWPTDRRGVGTHGLGLADMLALGRVLDRLPDRLVVVGVEAADVDHRSGLSEPVAAAVPHAVAAVLAALAGAMADRTGRPLRAGPCP